MVYTFNDVFSNLNNYCQDKTTKLKQSFSPARSSTASPLNSATSDLEPSPSSSSSISGMAPPHSTAPRQPPPSLPANIEAMNRPNLPPPLPKRNKPKPEGMRLPEPTNKNAT
ncbi:hypothetical protein M3Y97_01019300 [Aphelenchoides bicaudatus]|nr:hypothetical protein M3Y97_01019300 [Aphelenchoides bicaudatus]